MKGDLLRSRRVGLALSGGSVRGLAHIGVIVTPSIPAAGYVPGARALERMIAAGERAVWRELRRLGVGAA